jgi:hypothetical protein
LKKEFFNKHTTVRQPWRHTMALSLCGRDYAALNFLLLFLSREKEGTTAVIAGGADL